MKIHSIRIWNYDFIWAFFHLSIFLLIMLSSSESECESLTHNYNKDAKNINQGTVQLLFG